MRKFIPRTPRCPHCGKIPKEGEARYTITGAHWGCHERHGGEIRQWIRAYTGFDIEPRKPSGELRKCRANGGSLHHWVDTGSHVALCGHKPADTAKRMTKRGKWLVLREDAAGEMCRKCEERMND